MRSENKLEKLEMAFPNPIFHLRIAFLAKNAKTRPITEVRPIQCLDGNEGQGVFRALRAGVPVSLSGLDG